MDRGDLSVICIAVGSILLVVFFLFVLGIILDGEAGNTLSGEVTEKFRMGNNGVVTYYFVIDGEFDVRVNEEIYYEVEIGETHEYTLLQKNN